MINSKLFCPQNKNRRNLSYCLVKEFKVYCTAERSSLFDSPRTQCVVHIYTKPLFVGMNYNWLRMLFASLIPRPFFEERREKGLVHIACVCAGSLWLPSAGERFIVNGLRIQGKNPENPQVYMRTCDCDRNNVIRSSKLPYAITPDFSGVPGACACNVYQALSPPPLKKGPGYEAGSLRSPGVASITLCVCTVCFFFARTRKHLTNDKNY